MGFDHYLNSIYLNYAYSYLLNLSIKNKKEPPKNIKSGYSYSDCLKSKRIKKPDICYASFIRHTRILHD